MHAKKIGLFVSAVSCLMGCTTRPDPELAGPTAVSIPPPEVSIELPLEQKAPREPLMAQACLLSTAKSCMDLDSRPFEACLAGSKDCRDKGDGGIVLLEKPRVHVAPTVDYPGPSTR
jgi:hypothetical protein